MFTNANLTEALFEDCTWSHCELSNCGVHGTRFRRARISQSRARGVQFFNCHTFGLEFEFIECNLSYSSFSGLHLPRTKFKNCKLNETDFQESELVGSDFEGRDLTGTIFHRTNLTKCDLSQAEGVCLDLEHNRVKGLKLSLSGATSTLAALGIELEL
ncbi:MAG: pentapeptide repeat-containing protein [Nannocystaceae bacterium]